jgi:hypothetical protein
VLGALLVGFLNALAGDPLSGPAVEAIRVAFLALLLLVPGLVFYRQLTRAGTRGSAVRLSRRQFPDIYSLKEDFARRLALRREPEIYLMSGNGTLNAFAASTFGHDFVVIHSELFSNTYERNKEALAFIVLAGRGPASPVASFHGAALEDPLRCRVFRGCCREPGSQQRRRRGNRNLATIAHRRRGTKRRGDGLYSIWR